MKRELIKIYNKHLTPLDSGDFGSGVQLWMSEQDFLDALHDYELLKVAEATLPNVKDWDEVYKKFKENYKNSEHILHPINFLSWLKQHYLLPSEQTPHPI
jgi:hypothetical protein